MTNGWNNKKAMKKSAKIKATGKDELQKCARGFALLSDPKAMGKADLQEGARGFALLSDPTRLGILTMLAGGPKNVTALCKGLGLKQPTISHHLGLLRMGRLVIGTRKGKSVVYEADKTTMRVLSQSLSKLRP
jgi:DNA-binding transcriptional ArsR family regulator